jgi:hypothetical protein
VVSAYLGRDVRDRPGFAVLDEPLAASGVNGLLRCVIADCSRWLLFLLRCVNRQQMH